MGIDKIRAFNRFYARILGIFDKNYLGADFSVTEVRIIGEIGRNSKLTAKHLASYLQIDKGYMSRILQGLEKRQLIARIQSDTDGRERYLCLTEAGKALNRDLEEKANRRIAEQLKTMDDGDYQTLLEAMDKIQCILGQAIPDTKEEE